MVSLDKVKNLKTIFFTKAFPGATIGRLSNLVANGMVNLKHIDFLIIHVGSNNIAIHQSVNQIVSTETQN
jgi:hypothetical protein